MRAGFFLSSLLSARSARVRGLRSPATIASSMARPDMTNRSETTPDSLICTSCRALPTRVLVPGTFPDEHGAGAGEVPQLSHRLRWDDEARTMPRSASLASRTASSLSVFGRPGTFFTSRALTSQQSRPLARADRRTGASTSLSLP